MFALPYWSEAPLTKWTQPVHLLTSISPTIYNISGHICKILATWRWSKDYIVTHTTHEQGTSDHVLTPISGIYWSLAGQMLPAMKAQFCERSSKKKKRYVRSNINKAHKKVLSEKCEQQIIQRIQV